MKAISYSFIIPSVVIGADISFPVCCTLGQADLSERKRWYFPQDGNEEALEYQGGWHVQGKRKRDSEQRPCIRNAT